MRAISFSCVIILLTVILIDAAYSQPSFLGDYLGKSQDYVAQMLGNPKNSDDYTEKGEPYWMYYKMGSTGSLMMAFTFDKNIFRVHTVEEGIQVSNHSEAISLADRRAKQFIALGFNVYDDDDQVGLVLNRGIGDDAIVIFIDTTPINGKNVVYITYKNLPERDNKKLKK